MFGLPRRDGPDELPACGINADANDIRQCTVVLKNLKKAKEPI